MKRHCCDRDRGCLAHSCDQDDCRGCERCSTSRADSELELSGDVQDEEPLG